MLRILNISLLLLISVFFSCSVNTNKNDGQIANTTIYIKDSIPTNSNENEFNSDSIKLREYNLYYKTVTQPVTFSKITSVYSSADTASKIIAKLNFNTSLSPIKNSHVTDWFLIEYENDTAYVRTKDVALYSFPSSKNKNINYFIKEEKETTIIYKYDFKVQKFTDSFKVEFFIPQNVGFINSANYENTELIIYLNMNGNCCGCSSNQIYIMDANNEFKMVFKTSQFIEDGDVDAGFESHAFFPQNPETQNIIYTESNYGYEEGNVDIKKYFNWDGRNLVEITK